MLDERLRIEDPSSYSERRYVYLIKYNYGKKTSSFFSRNEGFRKVGSSVAHITLPFAIKDEEALKKVEEHLKKQQRGGRHDILIESFSFFSE